MIQCRSQSHDPPHIIIFVRIFFWGPSMGFWRVTGTCCFCTVTLQNGGPGPICCQSEHLIPCWWWQQWAPSFIKWNRIQSPRIDFSSASFPIQCASYVVPIQDKLKILGWGSLHHPLGCRDPFYCLSCC